MRLTQFFFACLCFTGCTPADEPATRAAKPAAEPDARQILDSYKTLRAMTRNPVWVDPVLADLCRGITQADVEAAQKIAGPHAQAAVMIYMSEPAADAFKNLNPTYPVGSIVVKEKRYTTTKSTNQLQSPDGIGGMIKRPPGYDPASGNWEYFYSDTFGKLESGKLRSCMQCHASAGKDHVFGDWARRE